MPGAQMFGYTREEFLNSDVRMLFFPEEVENVFKRYRNIWIEGGFLSSLRLRNKDGIELYVDINITPLYIGGEDFVLGVVRNITERKLAEEKLKSSRKKAHDLALHLQNLQEVERGRIARDIHDDLGQILTVLDFDITYVAKKLLPEQKDLLDKTKKASGLIRTSMETIQRIASELRPSLLDDLGLMAAMEWQAEEYYKHTGIDCKIIFDPKIEIDNRDLTTALFRAFQEALTNVARHADATSISVKVSMDDSCLILEVIDNGTGIRTEDISSKNSFGLLGMSERFMPFGGNVKIKGREDKGTTICITVPLGGIQ